MAQRSSRVYTQIESRDYSRELNLILLTLSVSLISHLFYGQVLELWQGAGEDANEERGRRAHDVDHGSWQDRDVGVLPGEGVKCCHCSVPTFRQSAGEVGEAQGGWSVSPLGQAGNAQGRCSLCISRGSMQPLLNSLTGS